MPELDDFNRADSNSLGASWTEVEDAAADLSILTNELKCDDAAGADRGFAYWNTDLGGDHYSELEYRSHDAPFIQPLSGPAVRIPTTATVANFTGYVVFWDPGGAQLSLRKYNGESLGNSGAFLATYFVTLVSGDRIRIEAVGSTIKVYRNGDEVMSVVDAVITGGRPGVAMNPGYIL